jgi:hypothetical protein
LRSAYFFFFRQPVAIAGLLLALAWASRGSKRELAARVFVSSARLLLT